MSHDHQLVMWTVYDHPADFPNYYVVRACLIIRDYPEPVPCFVGCLYTSLDEARHDCRRNGASGFFSPSPGDDPVILETWI